MRYRWQSCGPSRKGQKKDVVGARSHQLLRRVRVRTKIAHPYGLHLHRRTFVVCLRFPALEELDVQYLVTQFIRYSANNHIVDKVWGGLNCYEQTVWQNYTWWLLQSTRKKLANDFLIHPDICVVTESGYWVIKVIKSMYKYTSTA